MVGIPSIQKSPQEGDQLESYLEALQGSSASDEELDALFNSDDFRSRTDSTGLSGLGVERESLNQDVVNALVRKFIGYLGDTAYDGSNILDSTRDEFGTYYYRMNNSMDDYDMREAQDNNSQLANQMRIIEEDTYYRMNNVYPPLTSEERSKIESDLEAMRVCRSYLDENNSLMDYDFYGSKRRVNNRISVLCRNTTNQFNSNKNILNGSLNGIMNTTLARQIKPMLSSAVDKTKDPKYNIINRRSTIYNSQNNGNPYLGKYGEDISSGPEQDTLLGKVRAKIKSIMSNFDTNSSSRKYDYPFPETQVDQYSDMEPDLEYPQMPSRRLPPSSRSRNSMYLRRRPTMRRVENLPSSRCPKNTNRSRLFDINSMMNNINGMMGNRLGSSYSKIASMLSSSRLDINSLLSLARDNNMINDAIDCSCNCSQESMSRLRNDLYNTGRTDFNSIISNLDYLSSSVPSTCSNTKNYRRNSYNNMMNRFTREFNLIDSNIMNFSFLKGNSMIMQLLSNLLRDSGFLFGKDSMLSNNCLDTEFEF